MSGAEYFSKADVIFNTKNPERKLGFDYHVNQLFKKKTPKTIFVLLAPTNIMRYLVKDNYTHTTHRLEDNGTSLNFMIVISFLV